jgi:putative chitinase
MNLTTEKLVLIMPNARPVAGVFVSALNQAMARFRIDSPVRATAFLAQVGHESSQLLKLSESLYYKDATRIAQIFRHGFDANRNARVDPEEVADAQRYVRNPEALANRAYVGRMGNGPESSGDGWRYRGRGLIQITGRANYRAAGLALGMNLEQIPQLLEQPLYAALSAAWFWQEHGLNELADAGKFEAITRRINGGLTGQDDREALWESAKAVLA